MHLKPCPFCANLPNINSGSCRSLFDCNKASIQYWEIYCSNCDIHMRSDKREQLQRQWNSRKRKTSVK